MHREWLERAHGGLRGSPRRWLVTGAAGFIGSHLTEALLSLDQPVVGLDNLSTGRAANLEHVRAQVSAAQWARFEWVPGDIADFATVDRAMRGVSVVLHQAALGSVPLSLAEPLATHVANTTGFLHVLLSARAQHATRLVYASSSAVYGDSTAVPAREEQTGRPLSPYAASKAADELYAASFRHAYGFESVGLRYFNVLGPRQDPAGAYAAVIPRWIAALLRGEAVEVFGDGGASRDFCPVANVVHANLLAATRPIPSAGAWAFNVGLGAATSLNDLFRALRGAVARWRPAARTAEPIYRAARVGDIRHSCADLHRLQNELGFTAVQTLAEGLEQTVESYARAGCSP